MRDRIEFSIQSLRYLNAAGELEEPIPEPYRDNAWLLTAYRTMTLIRAFDTKAIALQRTGRIGTYASGLGQEAVGTAVGLSMQPTDILVPYYRDHCAQYLRGVDLTELIAYWGGDERANCYASEAVHNDLPICVPVGTQAAHAAGVAAAVKARKQARAVVCTMGDGATSRGDVMEAFNLAGVWHLPVVFVIVNNQWAISVRRGAQTAARTLAQKAIGAGIPGYQVDGNDAIGLRVVIDEALAHARANKGPTIVEAVTYRLSDHTTADDATRYRGTEEVHEAWATEPLKRLRSYLVATGLWNEAEEKRLLASCEAEIDSAVARYLERPPQSARDLFRFQYAQVPASLEGQMLHAERKAERVAARVRSDGDG